MDTKMPAFIINANTTIGKTTLAVADLERVSRFYENNIGLNILVTEKEAVELGVAGQPMLRLEALPSGRRVPKAAGLFHLAILLPSRAHLGQWLKHYVAATGKMIDGAGDHLVSEALYLTDPEGNGLEIYWDRPRDSWQYQPSGEVKMATLAVDLPAVAAAALAAPFTEMPAEPIVGHIHLQVANVADSMCFYGDLLGFGTSASFPGAGFLGAGGYHHHIGVNTWQSLGQPVAPAGSLGLRCFEIKMPAESDRAQLLSRLKEVGQTIQYQNGVPLIHDPSGIELHLQVA